MPGIFSICARGLYSLITDVTRVKPTIREEITLQADSDEELLVQWLNRLNFFFAAEGILFCKFERLEVNKSRLQVVARGEPYSPSRHEIYREIKAVTYHGLILKPQENGWYARVIFDL